MFKILVLKLKEEINTMSDEFLAADIVAAFNNDGTFSIIKNRGGDRTVVDSEGLGTLLYDLVYPCD